MYTKLTCVSRCWSTISTCLWGQGHFCKCRPGAHTAELHPKNIGRANMKYHLVGSWLLYTITAAWPWRNVVWQHLLKIFLMKSFYFFVFRWFALFWWGFVWVFFVVWFFLWCGFLFCFVFYYFKRWMARERGNLSKLFKCCLENGTLCPLSAVLAMCSHKSSIDWQLYFQPIVLVVSFALASIGKVLLITAVKLVISILSFTALLLNSVCV